MTAESLLWNLDAMRRHPGAFPLIMASALIAYLATPVSAQTPPAIDGSAATSPLVPSSPSPGRHISATGKMMPPAGGQASDALTRQAGSPTNASIAAQMLKAQKAAEARNKNWDTRMRKTMGSICSGC